MSTDQPSNDPSGPSGPNGPARKPWFRRNQGGVGFHPSSWQGVLVLVAVIAVIAVIVILIKTVVF
jgi:hypothetical protein